MYTFTVTIEINEEDLAVYTENNTLAESVQDTLNNAMPFGNVTVTER
jgi:hypothetical protein